MKILESRMIVFLFFIVLSYPVWAVAAGFIEGNFKPVIGEFEYSELEDSSEMFTTYDESWNTVSAINHIEFTTKNETYRDCKLKKIKWKKGHDLIFSVNFSDNADLWKVSEIRKPTDGKLVVYHKCHLLYNTITTIKEFKNES